MFTIGQNIINTYVDGINSLINQLGKPVILHFEDTVSPVSSGFYDVVRVENDLIPDFKQTNTNPAPIITENTTTILALMKWMPKEYEHFDQRVNNPDGLLRLKTFLTDVPNLVRCKYIVPDANSLGIINTKFRLIREPQPVGLQVSRYAITWWDLFS